MQRWKYFEQQEGGNIALLTAMLILPLIGLCGGAIDVARMMAADQKVRNAVESAVLAAASLTNSGDIHDVVNDYIAANLPAGPLRDSLVVEIPTQDIALNARRIEITATATIDPFFLGLFGVDEITLTSSAVAAQQSTLVEIALVVDVSSSMSGTKLKDLKEAAAEFVDQMLTEDTTDYTSISLIPFGGTVNIGQALFDELAPSPGSATINPGSSVYNIGDDVPEGGFSFTEGDYCIEYTNDDYGLGLIPAQSRSQVPTFWKWSNYNPWCPAEESAAIFNSNDADALKARIEEMLLSDGTGMNMGGLWGLKALSPEWTGMLGGDFADRPGAFDPTTLKVLIVMTDGEITNQTRPLDYTYYSVHAEHMDLRAADQYSVGNGQINNKNRYKNEQQILSTGKMSDAVSAEGAKPQFRRICSVAKDNGILVYTIGFKINKNSDADKILAECATNSGMYYFVENTDIQEAFRSIAASVSSLRIVG